MANTPSSEGVHLLSHVPTISENRRILLFSFKLSEDFIAPYRSKQAPFGYRDAGGNSVGEITFLRTYSRKKEDGTISTKADFKDFHPELLKNVAIVEDFNTFASTQRLESV